MSDKEVTIINEDGTESNYTIRKFKPIIGREIVMGYPLSALPKVGDYPKNETLMLKLMSTVSVKIGDRDLFLTTADLVNNHVKDWNSLTRLEFEVLKYNCSFLSDPNKVLSLSDWAKAAMREFLVEVFIEAQGKQA